MEHSSTAPVLHAPVPVTPLNDDVPLSDMIEEHAEWLGQVLSTSNDTQTQGQDDFFQDREEFDFSFLLDPDSNVPDP